MNALTGVHVFAGALGIVSGFTALFAGKGSTLHRRSGLVFVGAMVVMGLTGAVKGNIIGGLIATYFVVTALTAVRSVPRSIDVGLMLLGLAIGGLTVTDGLMTVLDGKMSKDGVPVVMILALGSITLLGVVGDIRIIRKGPLRGSSRIVRHLWRMCFSLWIASGSFFTIRKRVAMILPDPFLGLPLRMLPVVLPLLAIAYWVWRIKFRKSFKPVRIRQPADAL